MGGMIPFFAGKIDLGFRQIFFGTPERNPAAEEAGLKQHPRKYYEMLYADTALNGEVAATRCGHAFFKTAHCLFATDAPFCAEQGRGLIANTIAAVHALEISEAERAQMGKELKKLVVDNLWVIGTVGFTPNLRIISNKMGNVPERISWRSRCRTPGATHPSTYYLKS